MTIDWGDGPQSIGQRENVFSGFPHSVYLPCGISFEVRAESLVEFAETRVRSQKRLKPRIIVPAGVGNEIRGGGDTTRQIVRIIRPEGEADRLMRSEEHTSELQ